MNAYKIALALQKKPTPKKIESAQKWLDSNADHELADFIFRHVAAHDSSKKLEKWIKKSLKNKPSIVKAKLALRYVPTKEVIEKSLELAKSEPKHWESGPVLLLLLKHNKTTEVIKYSIDWLKHSEYLDSGEEIFQLLNIDKKIGLGSRENLKHYSEDQKSYGLLNAFIEHAPTTTVLKYSNIFLENFPGSIESGFMLSNLIKSGLLENPERQIDRWIKNGGREGILIEIVCSYLDQIGETDYLKRLCKKYAGQKAPKSIWANRYLLYMDDTNKTKDRLLSWLTKNLDHKYADSILVELLTYHESDELLKLAKEIVNRQKSDTDHYLLERLLESGVSDKEILDAAAKNVKVNGYSTLCKYLIRYRKKKYLPIAKKKVLHSNWQNSMKADVAVSYLEVLDDQNISKKLDELRDYGKKLEPDRRKVHWCHVEFRYACYLLDKHHTKKSIKVAESWIREFGKYDKELAAIIKEKISDA